MERLWCAAVTKVPIAPTAVPAAAQPGPRWARWPVAPMVATPRAEVATACTVPRGASDQSTLALAFVFLVWLPIVVLLSV